MLDTYDGNSKQNRQLLVYKTKLNTIFECLELQNAQDSNKKQKFE